MPNIDLAVILAAGTGRRLNGLSGDIPKPLVKLHGIPLLEHVMLGARDAGIERFAIVIGYQAEMMRRWFVGSSLHGIQVTWVENSEYRRVNGISLLAARPVIDRPFLLLMADHIFDAKTAGALLRQPLGKEEAILGVDHKLDRIFDLEDATKVQRMGDHIIRIGKTIKCYDAVDTGMFLCTPAIFDSLEAVVKNGNCSLSDGMQYIASNRRLRAYDIENALWQDIDTPEAFNFARAQFLAENLRLRSTQEVACA